MQHHAYVYEGLQHLYPLLLSDARERFAFTPDDPDLFTRQWETLGIDEVREIIEHASLKSISGKALLLVGVSTITAQAQQALLKLAEEPTLGTTLVLLVSPGILQPALRSRFLPYPAVFTQSGPTSGSEFLHLSQTQRSKQLTELLANEEGVRERVQQWLNDIEKALQPLLESRADVREALDTIQLVRSYLFDHGASVKLLLEHLVLVLPVI